jgi:hypothetical protein
MTYTLDRGRRALAFLLLAALATTMLVLGQTARPVAASHYRATQVTWQRISGNEVDFHATASWRCTYFFPGGTCSANVGDTFFADSVDFGDGEFSSGEWTVTAVDVVNDVISGELEEHHLYASAGPFTAAIETCCRLSSFNGHINNGDGGLRTETIVDLNATSANPISSVAPIVDCAINAVCSFVVPAFDPDGQALRWRLSTSAEAAGSFGSFVQPGPAAAPNAASIAATTGLYTWDTTGATLAPSGSTFYSTQVMVENVVGGVVVTKTPVDFFIRLGSNTSNQAPAFQAPTPADGTTLNASVGSPVDFSVTAADPDATDVVTLNVLGLPTGATFTTSPANPANGAFTWTPTATGTFILTLLAQDNQGLGATPRSVTIAVGASDPAPTVDAGPAVNGVEGSAVALDGTATDNGPITTEWTSTLGPGVDTGATCTFADPGAVDTTITCTDDGTYTLTLTADDGHNPPESDTTTVGLLNADPSVSISDPADLSVWPVGVAVELTAPFSDDGANDTGTHTCDVDWGDVTSSPGTIAGGVCSASHSYTAAGDYTVSVAVRDDDGGEGEATITLTVTDAGMPHADPDEADTTEDTPVEIFVLTNDSDPEGDLLEITAIDTAGPPATQGTVVINDDPDPEVEDTVTFTPALNFNGTTTFTYTVSDGNGGEATATVTVTVEPTNDEPVVVPGPDRTTDEGTAVRITGSATDVDGPLPLSYHWVILEAPEVADEPAGTFVDPDAAITDFTPRQDGTYVLQLEACDADGLCDTDVEDDTVEVTVGNVAPAVTLPANRTVTVGAPTSVTVTFTDPSDDDTHAAVIDWGDGSADTHVDPAVTGFGVSHTFTATGIRTVEACVDDDDDRGCDTMTITVVAPVTLNIRDAAIREPDRGTAPMTFTINANPRPTAPVTVRVQTVNGSARAPGDFTSLPAPGQLVTFAAGQASRTVTVSIVGDLLREANESFTVVMSNPQGASIGDGSALGRITNNDVCTILGTAGADMLNGGAGNDVLCGLGGNDVIDGNGGHDTVLAGPGDDRIRGGTGNDILRGQDGDDVLNGEAGNDVIDGGAGIDEASWAGAPGAVTADLTTNVATGWGTDTLATLERARGGSFGDTLRGNGLRNSLWGGDGNDTLLGRSADDVLAGQNGNDTLAGGPGRDDLLGGIGSDTANGNDGNDDVRGEAGDDRVSGANGNDRVDGGSGVDLVKGDAGDDDTFGGPGNDSSPNGVTAGVHGGTGTNKVHGGTGTDYCSRGRRDTRTSCELP